MNSAVDVFISYARRDYEVAQRVARTLSQFHLVTWWDDRIELSQQWNQAILENLSTAKSVLVIWSKASIVSEWVNREANAALSQGKLIQLRIEPVSLLDDFQFIQAADLFKWERNTLPRGIRRVVNEIASRSGKIQPLNEYNYIFDLVISSEKVSKFIDTKKHHEGYFPKLDGPLYADFWEMMLPSEAEKRGFKAGIKSYDELRPGSRHDLSEERYYELVEYLSYDRADA